MVFIIKKTASFVCECWDYPFTIKWIRFSTLEACNNNFFCAYSCNCDNCFHTGTQQKNIGNLIINERFLIAWEEESSRNFHCYIFYHEPKIEKNAYSDLHWERSSTVNISAELVDALTLTSRMISPHVKTTFQRKEKNAVLAFNLHLFLSKI